MTHPPPLPLPLTPSPSPQHNLTPDNLFGLTRRIYWSLVRDHKYIDPCLWSELLRNRGGRKVRLIDFPIPIRSSDCIGRYNRYMTSSDFCIGRLYRFVLSSDSLIIRSCFLVSSSDFCIGRLCRFVLSSDSLIVRSFFWFFKFPFLYRAIVSASYR